MEDELKKFLFSIYPYDLNIKRAIKLKYNQIPPSLYKYNRIDDKSLSNLETDFVNLENPINFNDPFDSVLSVIWNKNEKSFFKRYLRNLRPSAKESYLIDTDQVKAGLSISCFSETNRSILMWSHYSNKHQGFCVEYDFTSLDIDDHRTRFLFPVIYTKIIFNARDYLYPNSKYKFDNIMLNYFEGIKGSLFNFTDYLNSNQEKLNHNNMLLFYAAINKSDEWSYEKEWRYVVPFGRELVEEQKVHMNVPKPKAVYLGAKISKKEKKQLLEIVERRNFKAFQMIMKPSEFVLEPERIL